MQDGHCIIPQPQPGWQVRFNELQRLNTFRENHNPVRWILAVPAPNWVARKALRELKELAHLVRLDSLDDRVQLLKRLNVLFYEFFPPRGAMLHARKFLAWFSAGFPGCHEFRRKVFSITDDALLWEEARHFFEESGRHRDLRFMSQPFLMGGHG